MKFLIALILIFSSSVNASWVLRDNNGTVNSQYYIAVCYDYFSTMDDEKLSDTEKDMKDMYTFHYHRTLEIGLTFSKVNIDFKNPVSKKLTKEICARMYFMNEAEDMYNDYLETGK